ncbi:hypothetical protein LOK46_10710 [Methylobacterium sp. NMS14P]|uniref:hypothetical protein n=1 Tax=Methylobacterium sp. NMS14P TaxID=2894310 RepID=UPI0023596071|nr:hypothetical protein [Methylobacterium sp. NMS14P]WCS27261.1 hypothetical protein LOK46_10710 [Methylobacterium sp. NMS14P]
MMTTRLVHRAAIVARRLPVGHVYSLVEIADVLSRWDAGHGPDTATIALSTRIPEAKVSAMIALDQDIRHAERAASRSAS